MNRPFLFAMMTVTLLACDDPETWPGYTGHDPDPVDMSDHGNFPQLECPVPPPIPIIQDACTGANDTNLLIGACWSERCVKGERRLVKKVVGVNCVYIPDGAQNDEFTVGVCDDSGACWNGTVEPPPE
jgi:hypothetical protein